MARGNSCICNAACIALLIVLSASAQFASAHSPSRKLLQSTSASSNQSTAAGPTRAPPVNKSSPAPAPIYTGDSSPAAAAPAPADVNMSAPMQGTFPPLYQPPQLQDDPSCATDDTLFQLVFTGIADLLGIIPEVGTILQDYLSFIQGQTQQGVWEQVQCRVEALIAQAIDKQAWGLAQTAYNATVSDAYDFAHQPGRISFQELENFLDNNFNNGGTIADMEGASGNYGQQMVLLPMYVQWANVHIATLRNALWGPLRSTISDMTSDDLGKLSYRLTIALSNHKHHVDSVVANYEPPAGSNNCFTFVRKNAYHRMLQLSVFRGGRMYWDTADQQTPPAVIDTVEIYSDPTGYNPSFTMHFTNQWQQDYTRQFSYCMAWNDPVIPWPPVTPYHAAHPDDKIQQMRVVADYRIDRIAVKYANAADWDTPQGETDTEGGAWNDDFGVPPMPGDDRLDPIVQVEMLQQPFLWWGVDWYLDGAFGMRLHFNDSGVRPLASDGVQVDGWWGATSVDSDQASQWADGPVSLSYPGYILSSVYAPGPLNHDWPHNYQGALNFIFGWRRADSYPH